MSPKGALAPQPEAGLLVLLAYPMLGSLVSVMLRYLLRTFDPWTVAGVRSLSGGLFLLCVAFVLWRGELRTFARDPRQLRLLLVTTLLGIVPGWLTNEAISRIPALVASLLGTLSLPLMSVLAALVFADERRVLRSSSFWLAAPLLLGGTAGLALAQSARASTLTDTGGYGLGIAMLLLSFLLNAIPQLFLKHAVSDAHPFVLSGSLGVAGGLIYSVLAFVFGEPARLATAPTWLTVLLVLSGAYGLLTGSALYLAAVKRFGLIVVNLVWLISPVFVGLFGYEVLNELPTAGQLWSGLALLAGCGIVLISRNAAKVRSALEAEK